MKTATVDTDKLREEVTQLAAKAKAASSALALVSTDDKNAALLKMADEISGAKDKIVKENEKDVAGATKAGLSAALIDRLTLDPLRVEAIAKGLREMAARRSASRKSFSRADRRSCRVCRNFSPSR
jgi:glutamate-5-semialdehyde dehydrogenase